VRAKIEVGAHRGRDFADAVAHREFRREVENAVNLLEADAIVAWIRDLVLEADRDLANDARNDLTDLRDAMVVLVAADVEYFAGDFLAGRLERHEKRPRRISAMHVRAPLPPAEDGNRSIDDRAGGESVHHEVEAHAR